MPIQSLDLTVAPGFLVQSCAYCGRARRLNLDRGGSDTKAEPFDIPEDSTLEVKVDSRDVAQTVTFDKGSFPNPAAVTALQLRDKLNATLVGVSAALDYEGTGVSIESDTTGAASRVEVTGGQPEPHSASPPMEYRTRVRVGLSSGGTLAMGSRTRTSSASGGARVAHRSSSSAPGTRAIRSSQAATTTSTAGR